MQDIGVEASRARVVLSARAEPKLLRAAQDGKAGIGRPRVVVLSGYMIPAWRISRVRLEQRRRRSRGDERRIGDERPVAVARRDKARRDVVIAEERKVGRMHPSLTISVPPVLFWFCA